MRTEKFGLRDHLWRRKVPEFDDPGCECGEGRQTVPPNTRVARMSPIKWPEVGKVAPHYLEHGIILLDEAAKLQAMARQKPIPMNVISPFIDSLTEYVRKTREQPTMQELLMEIRNGFKETRDIHEKVAIIKQGWDTTRPAGSLPLNSSSGIRSWAQIAATSPGTAMLPSLGSLRTSTLPKTASRHLD
ncbi:hypothetical protein BCON_0327g00030 [Botryotinia convoluta]|uniref:Uncharacterized protein n=1 Tax=Botryotinia convoluta TaxID=54673 RepID=A0A4Z1HN11_9HELO|nr:hypothetical protein BCON_0327g00030 [Botryotinia convoluta]